MGLNNWTMTACSSDGYLMSAPVRVTAEHLAGLPVPETLIELRAFSDDAQENKTTRILPGAARAAARLAWPTLCGADAVTGLPVILVIQAGALRYELERLASVTRADLEPVDADNADAIRAAWAGPRAWLSRIVSERRALRVQYCGEGRTAEGQIFPRFRLALVGADAAAGYREAWLEDAAAARRTVTAAPVALLEAEAPATDPIPF
jgi:hypothetical protein